MSEVGGSAENALLRTIEYEIHFNRGYGWQDLSEAIRNSSPVPTAEQAWENVERMRHVATADGYYADPEVRVVRVDRSVIPPAQRTQPGTTP